MTVDKRGRNQLAEPQREFSQYCGDAFTRIKADVYAMRRIARKIEALVRKRAGDPPPRHEGLRDDSGDAEASKPGLNSTARK